MPNKLDKYVIERRYILFNCFYSHPVRAAPFDQARDRRAGLVNNQAHAVVGIAPLDVAHKG